MRKVYWYGTVALVNGTQYSFDVSNMAEGQTSITRQLCDKISIGNACSAELKITFMLDYDPDSNTYSLNGTPVNRYAFKDGLITLTFRLILGDDDYYEDVPCGTFIINDTERSANLFTCTAYDYMQKFSKKCSYSTQLVLPYNLLLVACSTCGVELGTDFREIKAMPNGNRTTVVYDPKNQITTWRNVIEYVAAFLCANAVIKADNKLYIIPFKEEPLRFVDPGNRVSLKLEDYKTTYGTITAIDLRSNTEYKVTVSSDGLTYQYGANPLAQYITATDKRNVVTNILNVLNTMDYTPFTSEFFCDPSYDVGDVIAFTGNHALESTKVIITNMVINVSGHMTVECKSESPFLAEAVDSSSSQYQAQTSGSVGDGVQFYDYISTEAQQVEDVNVPIASITYESSGMFRQEFQAEIELAVIPYETLSSGVYEEKDTVATITYFRNGVEVTDYKPLQVLSGGSHILHLMYFWDSDEHIPESTFEMAIKVNYGSVSVQKVHARIMQSGKAYPEVSNVISYIDISKYPTKEMYWRGEAADYTGLVVEAEYEDGRVVNITNQCTISPASGAPLNGEGHQDVTVSYNNNGKVFKSAFALEEIIPEELSLPVIINTHYYADAGEVLDYIIRAYVTFSNNTGMDVTSQVICNPPNGTEVTSNTPTFVTVTYYYLNYKVSDSFDLEIDPVEFDLKYVDYTQDDEHHYIRITGLNTTQIKNDKIKALKIPDHYTEPYSGVTYQVKID